MTAVWTFFQYPFQIPPKPLPQPFLDNQSEVVSGPRIAPEARSGSAGPYFSLINFYAPLLHVFVFYTSLSTCKATYKWQYDSVHKFCLPPILGFLHVQSASPDPVSRINRKYVLNSLFSCLIK